MVAFEWDADNIAHIARHGVTPIEVQEAMGRKWIKKTASVDGYFFAYGMTLAGRFLTIVYTMRGGLVRPATAYTMNRKDRKLYAEDLKKDL